MSVREIYLCATTIINSCEGETSDVLHHSICKKWYTSNIDNQNFQRTLSKFEITKLCPQPTVSKRTIFQHNTTIPYDSFKTRLLDTIHSWFFDEIFLSCTYVISHTTNYLETTLFSWYEKKIKSCNSLWNSHFLADTQMLLEISCYDLQPDILFIFHPYITSMKWWR